jgi:hypothetical protein
LKSAPVSLDPVLLGSAAQVARVCCASSCRWAPSEKTAASLAIGWLAAYFTSLEIKALS